MAYQKYCPPLKKNKAHARNLQKSLNLSLGVAQTIVAHCYDCHNWQELKQRCDQLYDSSSVKLPMKFLRPHEVASFKLLVDNYYEELKIVFQSKFQLSKSLISLIVHKDYDAIEHFQIEQILRFYEEYGENFISFKKAIDYSESSAARIIDGLLTEPSSHPYRLWLRTSMYQQNIYAYCHINEVDKVVVVTLREWYTDLQVLGSSASVSTLGWFVKYMIGYITMLAQQFLELGYQPTFEFIKIQNTLLSSLTPDYENLNHPQYGILKLVRSLIQYSESQVLNYDEITHENGIKLAFTNRLLT